MRGYAQMQQDEHRFRGSTNVREDKCVYSENYYIEILQFEPHVYRNISMRHACPGRCTCVWRRVSENTCCASQFEKHMCLEKQVLGHACAGRHRAYVWKHKCVWKQHTYVYGSANARGDTIVDNHTCGARTRNICVGDTNGFI